MRRALICALLAVATPAGAQDDAEAARALFRQGTDALARGDAAAAIPLLSRSLERLPHRATAYNLAVALETERRDVEAGALLVQLLDGELGSLGEDEARDARALFAMVRERVGVLRVSAIGAPEPWLRIDDGPPRAIAEEPIAIVLAPGQHVLRIGAAQRRPRRLALRIAAGEEDAVRVRLDDRATGTLIVRAPGERVEIVGSAAGPSPLEREVPAGVYEVGIVAHEVSRRTVRVDPGGRVSIDVARGGGEDWAIGLAIGGTVAVVLGALAGVIAYFATEPSPTEEPVFGIIAALE